MDKITTETWLDKTISWFSPIRGANRLKARTTMALVGGYTGASKARRAFENWSVTQGDADSDTLLDLPTLRERSRDLIRNNPLAGGAINTKVTNIVGSGLRVKSQIDYKYIGITEDQAEEFQQSAERVFKIWGNSKECDLNRKLNFPQMQSLAIRSVFENGDVFSLLPFVKRPGSDFGTKIQLIEADRVSNPNYMTDNEIISGGIQKDKNGAPLKAFISDTHPGAMPGVKANAKWQARSFYSSEGRKNLLHTFYSLRVGQSRGVPDLATVIEPLKQLGRYTEAELMAAVISGMFTVFITTEDGDGDLANLSPTSEGGSKGGDESYNLGNGSIVGLAPGDSVSTANPGRPNDKFDPFVLAILRQVGVGLELPYEILIKHFTASYSASRAALLEAWRMFKTRRQWFAADWCQPIFEAVVTEAVSSGVIAAPGFFSSETMRAAYLQTIWTGDAPGQLDPLKETNAARARIDGNLSTEIRETMELTGGDWELDQRRRKKERQRHKDDGTQPLQPGMITQETPESDDDEKKKEQKEAKEND